MKRLLCVAAIISLLIAASPAQAISFNFNGSGTVTPSDCPGGPPQPLCVNISGGGVANDTPDTIPGSWVTTLAGQVLFFSGTGTFYYDDQSAANNDFFGTWQDVLGPPDVSGIAEASFNYVVTGGTGMFAGMTGVGTSIVRVLVGGPPPSLASHGILADVACQVDPNGAVGSYCEVGQFTIGAIPEPATLSLLALGALAALGTRRRRRF